MNGILKLSLKRRFLRDFWEGPIPFIEERLLKRIKTGTILDFGCGKGVGMKRFIRRGWEAIGLDPQLVDLRIAKVFGHVVCGAGEWIPFADETFDVVISSHVLHHMAGPQKGLQEIFRCLKPGGYLLLAETLENNPLLRLARNIIPCYEGTPIRSRYIKEWLKSKTLAKISYLLPSMMDSLETYLMTKVKPLREYCLQYYVLAHKDRKSCRLEL